MLNSSRTSSFSSSSSCSSPSLSSTSLSSLPSKPSTTNSKSNTLTARIRLQPPGAPVTREFHIPISKATSQKHPAFVGKLLVDNCVKGCNRAFRLDENHPARVTEDMFTTHLEDAVVDRNGDISMECTMAPSESFMAWAVWGAPQTGMYEESRFERRLRHMEETFKADREALHKKYDTLRQEHHVLRKEFEDEKQAHEKTRALLVETRSKLAAEVGVNAALRQQFAEVKDILDHTEVPTLDDFPHMKNATVGELLKTKKNLGNQIEDLQLRILLEQVRNKVAGRHVSKDWETFKESCIARDLLSERALDLFREERYGKWVKDGETLGVTHAMRWMCDSPKANQYRYAGNKAAHEAEWKMIRWAISRVQDRKDQEHFASLYYFLTGEKFVPV